MKDLAMVVHVLDYELQIVINKGQNEGVKIGDQYLIYELGSEIFDPQTEQSLGRLEIVKGKGIVVHVQEKMATIESIEKSSPSRTITKRKNRNPIISFQDSYEEVITGESEVVAFNNPKYGDYAKLILQ